MVKKKFLGLFLALILVIGASFTVFADPDDDAEPPPILSPMSIEFTIEK